VVELTLKEFSSQEATKQTLLNFTFSDLMLRVWNQPWQECLHHGNRITLHANCNPSPDSNSYQEVWLSNIYPHGLEIWVFKQNNCPRVSWCVESVPMCLAGKVWHHAFCEYMSIPLQSLESVYGKNIKVSPPKGRVRSGSKISYLFKAMGVCEHVSVL
jgi:hypothetical protein